MVAKELAEKGHDVLILEEGGHYTIEHFKNLSTFERNTLMYRDAGMEFTLGFPAILVPTGKCIGGTTLINSGTCFRTPDSVLERWKNKFGLSNLSHDSISPYFDRVEEILGVEPVPENVLGGNNSIIKRGMDQLGLSGGPLVRYAPGCQGSGVCIFGCPTGAKQSMERSYLPLAFKSGVKLFHHCHVDRLDIRHDQVYRIDAHFNDPESGKPKTPLKIYPKKVVVACGTFQTPLLLKRSHIGRQSGQLGKNLTVHPTGKIMGIFDEVIDGHRGVPQGYSMTDFEAEGMMFETVFFPPWLVASSIFQSQEKHREIMEAYRRIGIFGFLVHDEGRGRILGESGGRPIIFYNMGKKEKELFVKGLKVLAQIFFAAGAKKLYPTLRNLHEVTSIEQIEKINPNQIHRRDLECAAFHPLGTCRMGSDPRYSVVNEEMRVHDMENLWVADGSIFPTSLGVNPQITIMAFATRCAEFVHNY